jgi:hypothetical protein
VNFTCERDGLVMHGETDDELVANVLDHVAEAHPDLAGQLTREDILAAIASQDATTDLRGARA